ncbi:uncharacterized protein LOC132068606 isoform X2 [Lycium ferocissimum]|uniref:uncharacterized protein LOC132068606 isoform X2 n=1 Tax=Lycium ferocissimum TaxID=112874 RepID=UPI0028167110|nr:uncharacterized protein LOC132068606 isoform X2 [Lycium ferocissimum]
MKELWEEFDSLMPCPGCPCPESKTDAEHFEYQRLMQFLMGLNKSFNQCRSQIMMMYHVPSVNKIYSLVVAEECQRILGKSNSVNSGGVTDGMAFYEGKNNMNFGGTSGKQSNASSEYFGGKMNRTHGGGQANMTNYGGGQGSMSYGGKGNIASSSGQSHMTQSSNFRAKKGNLFCEFCNWKGYTRETCYKLHGYPTDFKGEKGINTINTILLLQTMQEASLSKVEVESSTLVLMVTVVKFKCVVAVLEVNQGLTQFPQVTSSLKSSICRFFTC